MLLRSQLAERVEARLYRGTLAVHAIPSEENDIGGQRVTEVYHALHVSQAVGGAVMDVGDKGDGRAGKRLR